MVKLYRRILLRYFFFFMTQATVPYYLCYLSSNVQRIMLDDNNKRLISRTSLNDMQHISFRHVFGQNCPVGKQVAEITPPIPGHRVT